MFLDGNISAFVISLLYFLIIRIRRWKIIRSLLQLAFPAKIIRPCNSAIRFPYSSIPFAYRKSVGNPTPSRVLYFQLVPFPSNLTMTFRRNCFFSCCHQFQENGSNSFFTSLTSPIEFLSFPILVTWYPTAQKDHNLLPFVKYRHQSYWFVRRKSRDALQDSILSSSCSFQRLHGVRFLIMRYKPLQPRHHFLGHFEPVFCFRFDSHNTPPNAIISYIAP